MEGPSLVILKEALKPFIGKKIIEVSGYANKHVNFDDIEGQTLKWVKPWGKHLLYGIGKRIYKTHFGLFGSYRISEEIERNPSLRLQFSNGFVLFLISSVRELTKEEFAEYDWRVDTLAREWDEDHVLKLAKQQPETLLCDLLLDQNLFSGSGNIIKNEVLFRQRLYPELKVNDISARKLRSLVREVRNYSKDFYKWKKKYELRKHWQVYKQFYCKVSEDKLVRKKMGKWPRMAFYCPTCQPKLKYPPRRRRVVSLLMSSHRRPLFLPIVLAIWMLALSLSLSSCRKPDVTQREPCNDSTLVALSASREKLSASDMTRLRQLEDECREYQAAEANRGLLWPYILGGIAILAGALYVILSLVTEDDVTID